MGSENESLPSLYTSEGSSIPHNLPKNDKSSLFDSGTIQASIYRALESEQLAHEATKVQLEQEISARHDAEAETKRLAECNKGLVNSINLLKSTVRHMVNKESESSSDQVSLDRAVKEYHKDAENKNPADSILYDVLSNYKATQTTIANGQSTTTTFNLDLLNTPEADDKTDKAQLQRTLRRQMGLSSDTEEMKKMKDEYQHKIESIVRGDGRLLPELSEIGSPENKSSAQSMVEPAEALEHIIKPHKSWTPNASAPLDPMLQLPASFLSKYNKKVTDEKLPPVQTPRKESLTSAYGIKPGNYGLDTKRAPAPEKIIWMPDCPLIDWKIDNRHKDELRGNASYVETRSADSHFLDYPLRYSKSINTMYFMLH